MEHPLSAVTAMTVDFARFDTADDTFAAPVAALVFHGRRGGLRRLEGFEHGEERGAEPRVEPVAAIFRAGE
jgi:hypothetical protein